jgi:DNA polymerase I-like protein with 3'-5' exonuclease and polymerase domains
LQLGCDLSGIELRCFAALLAEFDEGRYARAVIEADIHTVNAEAFGITHLPNFRDMSKTTIYALLYGGGDAKVGSIIGAGADAGKRIKANFMKANPAYRKVVLGLQRQADRQGWISALDGGHLHVRSAHKALNTSLQSAGALVAKHWLLEINSILTDEYGWEHGWNGEYAMLGMYHDEGQFAVRAPGSENRRFEDEDDFDYASIEDEKKRKAMLAKRRLDWYLTNFPQMKQLADATKIAIKRTEEHFQFRCPLDCEYIIGRNWADCH